MINSIHDFKIFNPNYLDFPKEIRVKHIDDWKYEYFKLTDNIGYWLAESPFYDDGFEKFKSFVSQCPICHLNNEEMCDDSNPFSTIHLPHWSYSAIIDLLKQFYDREIYGNSYIHNPSQSEWGNIFDSSISKPLKWSAFPHLDYAYGIVGNMWFTNHNLEDTGTALYEYSGKIYNIHYDFMVDKSHPLYEDWQKIYNNERSSNWLTISQNELEKWGFKRVGIVPTKYNGMSLYKSNVPHNPYITERCKFRWSHTFAFSHEKFIVNTSL